MNAALKLAAFAAVLALVLGAAALAGSGVHPLRSAGSTASATAAMAMDEAAAAVRGLAVSDDSLTLRLARRTAPLGRTTALDFRIVDRSGRTVRHFDVEHTKRMHFIVVRRDLTGFLHLHTTQRADGSWTVRVPFAAAGTYRLFADFSVDDTPHTLADDLQVDGAFAAHPLPAAARAAVTDGLDVALTNDPSPAGVESELAFRVTRDGRPVRIQDYLGAKGHLVALREGDLAFLHVHPDADRLRFMATFPTAGRYRLFLQFEVGGTVHTAAFTHEVVR